VVQARGRARRRIPGGNAFAHPPGRSKAIRHGAVARTWAVEGDVGEVEAGDRSAIASGSKGLGYGVSSRDRTLCGCAIARSARLAVPPGAWAGTREGESPTSPVRPEPPGAVRFPPGGSTAQRVVLPVVRRGLRRARLDGRPWMRLLVEPSLVVGSLVRAGGAAWVVSLPLPRWAPDPSVGLLGLCLGRP